MAGVDSSDVELLVKGKVEDELKSLTASRKKDLTRTAKEVIETVLPEITKVITIAVLGAVNAALEQVNDTRRGKTVDAFQVQRQALLIRYKCDKLE